MNTNNGHNYSNRLADLIDLGDTIFHVDDLANLWRVDNQKSLRQTLSRYAKRGLLHRVYRGMYSVKDIGKIDPNYLGLKATHGVAYVSCETVLYSAGIINQPPHEVTIVSEKSRHFKIGDNRYWSRQLNSKFLFNDLGVDMVGSVRIASSERAVADMIYFNPKRYFDAVNSKIINWKKVTEIVRAVGYKIKLPKYDDITKQ